MPSCAAARRCRRRWPADESIMTSSPGQRAAAARCCSASVKPSIAGHLGVEQHQAERRPRAGRASHPAPGARRPSGRQTGHERPSCAASRPGCGGWWRCRRRPARAGPRSAARAGGRGSGAACSPTAEAGGEVERAALPGLALDPDAPAHQLAPAACEMARPSPVPPYRRVVEPSAWVNASKIERLLVGGDADAGVADR